MWKKHIYPRIYQYNITIHVSKNVHKQFPSSIHLHFHSWSFEQKWHILLGTKRLNFIGWASKKLMSSQTPLVLLNVKRFGGGWVSTPLEKICERQIFPQVPTGGEKTLTTSCGCRNHDGKHAIDAFHNGDITVTTCWWRYAFFEDCPWMIGGRFRRILLKAWNEMKPGVMLMHFGDAISIPGTKLSI